MTLIIPIWLIWLLGVLIIVPLGLFIAICAWLGFSLIISFKNGFWW